jgi:CRISPR-associated endonuclease Csn1
MRDLPKNKAWRFGPDAMQRFENEERGFLDRQLNDTRYISRLAKQFLDAAGAQTWVVNGRLTADLRHVWGLNAVLSSHNSAPPSTEADAVKKNRNDHRHHAIDAFVVACTDRSMVKAASDAAKVVEDEFAAGRRESMRLMENVPEPFEGYLPAVRDAAARIIVSHKPDHGVQGELHEGTNYGVVRTQDGGQRLATRKPITGLTANEIKNIGDDRIRRELLPLVDLGDAERKAVRGGRVGLHSDRQRISGSSAGCFLEVPIWGVMQGGRSPTGATPHIGGRIHAAIASGRLSKYVWSGVLAARLECGLFPL